MPENRTVAVETIPPLAGGILSAGGRPLLLDGGGYRLLLPPENEPLRLAAGGVAIFHGDVVTPPAPVVHKKVWWNFLLANEAGYLAENAPIDEVRFGMPGKRIVPGFDHWAAGWEVTYFASLFVVALGLRFLLGIQ